MKQIISLILALVSVTTVLRADTAEFERLQASYKDALDKATKPLTQTYLRELERLRDSYTRSANLEGALKVQTEIDAMNRGVAIDNVAKPAPQAALPKGNAEDMDVSIPANEVNGYKIGPLKKGTVITLRYLKGSWKPDGKVASDHPDTPTPERGEKSRLVIANGRYKTQAGPALAVVPAGTAEKPFSFTLGADVENVVLRINKDGNDYAGNPGAVTYHLKITRQP